MHSRICHTIGAILSFVIILTEIDKINKNRSIRPQKENSRNTALHAPEKRRVR